MSRGCRGTHSVGDPQVPPGKIFFFKLAAYQLPLKICHTAAIGKTAARQLIRGIILASVVNASSGVLITAAALVPTVQCNRPCCLHFLININD